MLKISNVRKVDVGVEWSHQMRRSGKENDKERAGGGECKYNA